MYSLGFNFEVPPESFIAEEDLPDDESECEPMIISVELSNMEKLVVCPRASATTKMDVGVGGRSMGDRSLSPMVAPMIVEIDVLSRKQGQTAAGAQNSNSNKKAKMAHTEVTSNPTPSVAPQSRLSAAESLLHGASAQPATFQTQPLGSEILHSHHNNLLPGVAVANSVNQKKEMEKISAVPLPKVESQVASYYGGGSKKAKRASAAAAASKIKASMDDTVEKAPSAAITQQLASLKMDKKSSPIAAATLPKSEDVVAELVRNSREGEKRKGGASAAAKSKSAQRVTGQEVGKEMASQVVAKVAQPMAAASMVKGNKRESRRRPSDKMEVDPSPVPAVTPASKAKEVTPPGRKAKHSQDVPTAASLHKTAPEPKSSPPSQQKTSATSQKNLSLAQRAYASKSSNAQKMASSTQKIASSAQKAVPQTQSGSSVTPKKAIHVQKTAFPVSKVGSQTQKPSSPLKNSVSIQKGSEVAQKTSPLQKSSVMAPKNAASQKGSVVSSTAVTGSKDPALAQKPTQKETGPAPKKPLPVHKDSVAQRPEVAKKSPGPAKNPVLSKKAPDQPGKPVVEKRTQAKKSSSSPKSKQERKSSDPAVKPGPTVQASARSKKSTVTPKSTHVSVKPIQKHSQAAKPSPVSSSPDYKPAEKDSMEFKQSSGSDVESSQPAVVQKPVAELSDVVQSAEPSKYSTRVAKAPAGPSQGPVAGNTPVPKASIPGKLAVLGEEGKTKEVQAGRLDISQSPPPADSSRLSLNTQKEAMTGKASLLKTQSHADDGGGLVEEGSGESAEVVGALRPDEACGSHDPSSATDRTAVTSEGTGRPHDVAREGTSYDVSATTVSSQSEANSSVEAAEKKDSVVDSSSDKEGLQHQLMEAVEGQLPAGMRHKEMEESSSVCESTMEVEESRGKGAETKIEPREKEEAMETVSSGEARPGPLDLRGEEAMEVSSQAEVLGGGRRRSPTVIGTSVESNKSTACVPEKLPEVSASSQNEEPGETDSQVCSEAQDAARKQDAEDEVMEVEEEGLGVGKVGVAHKSVESEWKEGGKRKLHVRNLEKDEMEAEAKMAGEDHESQQPIVDKSEADGSMKTTVEVSELKESQEEVDVKQDVGDKGAVPETVSGNLTTAVNDKQEQFGIEIAQVETNRVEPEIQKSISELDKEKDQLVQSDEKENKEVREQIMSGELEGERGTDQRVDLSREEFRRGVIHQESPDKKENEVSSSLEEIDSERIAGKIEQQHEEEIQEDANARKEELSSQVNGASDTPEKKDPLLKEVVQKDVEPSVGESGNVCPAVENDKRVIEIREGGQCIEEERVDKTVGEMEVTQAQVDLTDYGSKEELKHMKDLEIDQTDVPAEVPGDIQVQNITSSDSVSGESSHLEESKNVMPEQRLEKRENERKDQEVKVKIVDYGAEEEAEMKTEGEGNIEERHQDVNVETSTPVGGTSMVTICRESSNEEREIPGKVLNEDKDQPPSEYMAEDDESSSIVATPNLSLARPTSILSTGANSQEQKFESSAAPVSVVEPEASAVTHKYSLEFRSLGFRSPRRTPPPASLTSLLDEDRLLTTSSLLQSPAPSLDDTSSLRVEPPSPRSEISAMDFSSFGDATPVDGQASSMELSGLEMAGISEGEPLPQIVEPHPQIVEPHPQAEQDKSTASGMVMEAVLLLPGSQVKEMSVEEKLGSEVSSEMSSLPPLATDDDGSMEGGSLGDAHEVKLMSAFRAAETPGSHAKVPESHLDIEATGSHLDAKAPESHSDIEAPGTQMDEEAPGSHLNASESHLDAKAPESHSDTEAPGSHLDAKSPESPLDIEPPGSHMDALASGSHMDAEAHGSHTDAEAHGSHMDALAPGSHMDAVAPGSHMDAEAHGSQMDAESQMDAVAPGSHVDAEAHGSHTDAEAHGSHMDAEAHGSHTDAVAHGSHTDAVAHGSHMDAVAPGSHMDAVAPGSHMDAGTSECDVEMEDMSSDLIERDKGIVEVRPDAFMEERTKVESGKSTKDEAGQAFEKRKTEKSQESGSEMELEKGYDTVDLPEKEAENEEIGQKESPTGDDFLLGRSNEDDQVGGGSEASGTGSSQSLDESQESKSGEIQDTYATSSAVIDETSNAVDADSTPLQNTDDQVAGRAKGGEETLDYSSHLPCSVTGTESVNGGGDNQPVAESMESAKAQCANTSDMDVMGSSEKLVGGVDTEGAESGEKMGGLGALQAAYDDDDDESSEGSGVACDDDIELQSKSKEVSMDKEPDTKVEAAKFLDTQAVDDPNAAAADQLPTDAAELGVVREETELLQHDQGDGERSGEQDMASRDSGEVVEELAGTSVEEGLKEGEDLMQPCLIDEDRAGIELGGRGHKEEEEETNISMTISGFDERDDEHHGAFGSLASTARAEDASEENSVARSRVEVSTSPTDNELALGPQQEASSGDGVVCSSSIAEEMSTSENVCSVDQNSSADVHVEDVCQATSPEAAEGADGRGIPVIVVEGDHLPGNNSDMDLSDTEAQDGFSEGREISKTVEEVKGGAVTNQGLEGGEEEGKTQGEDRPISSALDTSFQDQTNQDNLNLDTQNPNSPTQDSQNQITQNQDIHYQISYNSDNQNQEIQYQDNQKQPVIIRDNLRQDSQSVETLDCGSINLATLSEEKLQWESSAQDFEEGRNLNQDIAMEESPNQDIATEESPNQDIPKEGTQDIIQDFMPDIQSCLQEEKDIGQEVEDACTKGDKDEDLDDTKQQSGETSLRQEIAPECGEKTGEDELVVQEKECKGEAVLVGKNEDESDGSVENQLVGREELQSPGDIPCNDNTLDSELAGVGEVEEDRPAESGLSTLMEDSDSKADGGIVVDAEQPTTALSKPRGSDLERAEPAPDSCNPTSEEFGHKVQEGLASQTEACLGGRDEQEAGAGVTPSPDEDVALCVSAERQSLHASSETEEGQDRLPSVLSKEDGEDELTMEDSELCASKMRVQEEADCKELAPEKYGEVNNESATSQTSEQEDPPCGHDRRVSEGSRTSDGTSDDHGLRSDEDKKDPLPESQQASDQPHEEAIGLPATAEVASFPCTDSLAKSDALSQLIGDQDRDLEASSNQLLDRPSASEGEVSTGANLLDEGGVSGPKDGRLSSSDPNLQVDVDLMVHAEADDLSAFSSEAAEAADHFMSLSGSNRHTKAGTKRRSSTSSGRSTVEDGVLKKRRMSRELSAEREPSGPVEESGGPRGSKRPVEDKSEVRVRGIF